MECLRVNESGQITLPTGVMEEMGIETGMELKFVKNNNYIVLMPSTLDPLKEMQRLLAGEAERLGLETEDDFVMFSKEIRRKRAMNNANND